MNNWDNYQIDEILDDEIIIHPLKNSLTQSALIFKDNQWYVKGAETIPYEIKFLSFPKFLSHVTNLNYLYNILTSGQLKSRTETGASRGLSAATKGDPDWVYLSFDNSKPLIGKVLLLIDTELLIERDDYLLNLDWYYGPSEKSLTKDHLFDYLENLKGPGEILFKNPINLDKWLKQIVVPQLPSQVINIIKKANPNAPDWELGIVDLTKIPESYKDLIKVIF